MTDKNKRKKKNQARSATVRITDVSEAERLKVVAAIVLERLRKPDVLWIRVAGPHANTADDLQIGTKNRVDAYQVKWSEWAENLTFEQLSAESGLLKGLATSWKRMKEQYKLPVFVHLVTNDHPSPQKLSEEGKADFHLAKFLAAEWKLKPSKDGIWSDIWEDLQDATKLRDKEFSDFVEHCKFDCSYAVPTLDEDGEDDQPFHMVQFIHQRLFEDAGEEQHIAELNRAEIYELLGWDLDGQSAPQQMLKPSRSADGQYVQELWSRSGAKHEPVASAPPQAEVSSGTEYGSEPSGESEYNSIEPEYPSDTEYSDPLPSYSDDEQRAEGLLSTFLGKKANKEKKPWKSLAKGETQTSGLKRLRGAGTDEVDEGSPESRTDDTSDVQMGEPATADGDEFKWASPEESEFEHQPQPAPASDAPKKPDPARLRKLLGSRIDLEVTEEEQSEGEGSAEDPLTAGARHASPTEPDPEVQDFEPASQDSESDSQDADSSESEDAWKPSKKRILKPIDAPKAEPMPEGAFGKMADLQKRQEHGDAADSAEVLDAFLWYFNNGNELFSDGRFEEAEPEYIRALEILGSLDGPQLDKEFTMLENLGDIYQLLDRPEQSVELYERTRDERFTTKLPVAKYVAALLKLGSIYEDHNQFNEAEAQYRKAVDAASSGLEESDPLVERANSACLRVSKNRKTLFTRFDASEFDRFRDRQEVDKAIMYRKRKESETDIEQSDIWKGDITTRSEPVVVPEKPSTKKQWVTSIILFAITFAFAYAILVPNSGKSVVDPSIAESVVAAYSSTDGRKTMDLHGDGTSQFTFDGKFKDATYHFIGDDVHELLPLIPGHLRTNFVFFKMADKAVIDENGTYLYPHNAPELKLVESMWDYSKLAQEYSNEKFTYPESMDNWKLAKNGGTYKNPFSGKIEYATVTSASGDTHESYMRSSVEEGELWKNQPEQKPGAIACNTYNGRVFFIRGCDRNGKWLTSSEPKKVFYIELRRGLAATKEKLKEIKLKSTPTKDTLKDTSFIFEKGTEVQSRLGLMKTVVPGVLFLFVAFSLGLWRHRINKDKSHPVDIVLCVISIALLLAWYIVGLLDVT